MWNFTFYWLDLPLLDYCYFTVYFVSFNMYALCFFQGYYKDTVEFFFEGRNECKNFWKKCVENHGFFRCSAVKHVPRQKTRVLSRGSSFRLVSWTSTLFCRVIELQSFVLYVCLLLLGKVRAKNLELYFFYVGTVVRLRSKLLSLCVRTMWRGRRFRGK